MTINRRKEVDSIGLSGESFIADMYTGFIIESGKTSYKMYDFDRNSDRPFAKVLTSMEETGKLSEGESYVANQVGIRAVKLGANAPTAQEVHDLKRFISALFIRPTYKADKAVVGEFSGARFLNTIEVMVVNPAADSSVSEAGSKNAQGWCGLPISIPFAPNTRVGGDVEAGFVPPASLVVANQEWAIFIVYSGNRQIS